MAKVSVIIPSRNEQFLGKTVEELISKATGDVSVIVHLDGYWPDPPLPNHPNLHIIHRSKPRGMRAGINACAQIATGKYLMKVDAHCAFAEGWDEVLQADCDDNWVVIPRRYSLDPDTWEPRLERTPIDYEFLSYPYWKPGHFGLHGTQWRQRGKERFNNPECDIDDNMAFQGSCWFTTRDHFWKRVGGLQEEGYGTFIGEPQEVGMKTWLGGGRLITNKKTWYAHLHKGKRFGRGYSVSRSGLRDGNIYSAVYWMTNAWPERVHDVDWLVEKFWPVPSWPEDRSLWTLKGEDCSLVIAPSVQTEEKAIAKEPMGATDYIMNKYNPEIPRRMPIQLTITRDDLPALFTELGYKTGAEIGVERGLYSERLCQVGLYLYAIDAWTAYRGYREHVSQGKLDRFHDETRSRLASYNHQLIRSFSMDALKLFKDNSLDFVYIDGNHAFQHAANDIAEWSKKVRQGGIISGHDFSRNKKKDYLCQVKDVVQAWAYSHAITPWFITRGDRRSPSWFWVKE